MIDKIKGGKCAVVVVVVFLFRVELGLRENENRGYKKWGRDGDRDGMGRKELRLRSACVREKKNEKESH